MSKKEGKAFWGDSFWKVLHISAATYSPDKEEGFRALIKSYSILLPCDECKVHFASNIKKLNVDKYLTNNHDLFFWTYLLHDAVNQSHKPPVFSPPLEDIKKFYFKALGEECKTCS